MEITLKLVWRNGVLCGGERERCVIYWYFTLREVISHIFFSRASLNKLKCGNFFCWPNLFHSKDYVSRFHLVILKCFIFKINKELSPNSLITILLLFVCIPKKLPTNKLNFPSFVWRKMQIRHQRLFSSQLIHHSKVETNGG